MVPLSTVDDAIAVFVVESGGQTASAGFQPVCLKCLGAAIVSYTPLILLLGNAHGS